MNGFNLITNPRRQIPDTELENRNHKWTLATWTDLNCTEGLLQVGLQTQSALMDSAGG